MKPLHLVRWVPPLLIPSPRKFSRPLAIVEEVTPEIGFGGLYDQIDAALDAMDNGETQAPVSTGSANRRKQALKATEETAKTGPVPRDRDPRSRPQGDCPTGPCRRPGQLQRQGLEL